MSWKKTVMRRLAENLLADWHLVDKNDPLIVDRMTRLESQVPVGQVPFCHMALDSKTWNQKDEKKKVFVLLKMINEEHCLVSLQLIIEATNLNKHF